MGKLHMKVNLNLHYVRNEVVFQCHRLDCDACITVFDTGAQDTLESRLIMWRRYFIDKSLCWHSHHASLSFTLACFNVTICSEFRSRPQSTAYKRRALTAHSTLHHSSNNITSINDGSAISSYPRAWSHRRLSWPPTSSSLTLLLIQTQRRICTT